MSEEETAIAVEPLVEARLTIINGDTDDILLQLKGTDTSVNFSLNQEYLFGLIQQWTNDLTLLASPTNRSKPQ